MAGMEGHGRVFDTVAACSGVMFSMKNASAVTFVVTSSGAASLAVVAAKTYGGSTTNWTTANGFGQTSFFNQSTQVNGTAGWTRQTATWTSNSVALAGTTGYTSTIVVYTSQFADGYDYIEVTGTNTTVCLALLHDLTVSRTPANLATLGA